MDSTGNQHPKIETRRDTMSGIKRVNLSLFCLSFAGFCFSFAKLSMDTFQGFDDEGMIDDPFYRDSEGHYSIWLYFTIGFLPAVVFFVWRLWKLDRGKGKDSR